ncbi:MAG: 1,6-anhydro-N-acetylmuramyl-L-alanine amidase AmpD [Pseudomonadota bacterium]|nr:1,6-anhydro-N-acetylmuramyl-L-alanine amidase AmpD [Pseudomonadota bacterium]
MRLSLDKQSGLIIQARQISSPNCDARPDGLLPELIVLHCISLPPGEYGGPWIDQLFCNSLNPLDHEYFAQIYNIKVSAHFMINRLGELTQYVPIHLRAWHAGNSNYLGRKSCNDYSIGIELEGDEINLYSDFQYKTLVGLIKTLRNGIESLANAPIVGHNEIAPGRKTDPGEAFDWNKLQSFNF